MKNAYQRMNKEEKIKTKESFRKTEKGKSFYKNYKSCMIISIILIAYGIYLAIDAYISKLSKGYYFYALAIIAIGILFIVTLNKEKSKILSRYSLKKDKN